MENEQGALKLKNENMLKSQRTRKWILMPIAKISTRRVGGTANQLHTRPTSTHTTRLVFDHTHAACFEWVEWAECEGNMNGPPSPRHSVQYGTCLTLVLASSTGSYH